MVIEQRNDPEFAVVLAAAKQSQAWAFERLYRTWNQPLTAFTTARGIVDVDDVVSETFLGVFRSISKFSGSESDFRAWIFRIARNKVADDYRRNGRSPVTVSLANSSDVIGGDVEADAWDGLSRQQIEKLLHQLSDDQRDVLLLRLVADLTIGQIAGVMDRRPGAIKQLQRRALLRLDELLSDKESPFAYLSERYER